MDQWPQLTENHIEARHRIQTIRDELKKVHFDRVPSLQEGAQQSIAEYANTLLVPAIGDFLELVKDIDEDSKWLSASRAVVLNDFVAEPLCAAWEIVRTFKNDVPGDDARQLAIGGMYTSEKSDSNRNGIQDHLTIALPFLQTFLAYKRTLEDSDVLDRFSKTSLDCTLLNVQSEKTLQEAEHALKAAESAATQRFISRESEVFQNTSGDHAACAFWWLLAAVGLASTIIIAALFVMNFGSGPPKPDLSWLVAANLAHFAVRALCISILSFGLVAALRNYRAEKHIQVINEHRSGALATYRIFKDIVADRISDAVVLQAMEAVFAPQPTGYVSNDASASTHITELLNAIKPDAARIVSGD